MVEHLTMKLDAMGSNLPSGTSVLLKIDDDIGIKIQKSEGHGFNSR